MKHFSFWIFILLLFTGCDHQEEQLQQKPYFPLKDFMLKEAERRAADKTVLVKTIRRDSLHQTRTELSPDWNQELKPFADCDLNRPAWINRYKVDSMQKDNQIIFTYTATEKQFAVRSMEITQTENKVQHIRIKQEKGNSYFTLKQNLIYDADNGFEIDGFQETILAEPVKYRIEAEFR